MGLFGSAGADDVQRRVEELERRVAALERAMGAAVPPSRPVGEPNETWASVTVRNLVLQGKKIEAIKVFRDETGLSLREAKDIVERLG
ncbi:50S ribosomal protein L12 [Mycolicibacterium cosmeticum]|uniref:50S ribosomal protein L12 n=1 Tax=Mycolicibacterium cosmeticum TaxID=258533 RepID=W9AIP3_MYCCO|nr:ribosomal protein L7/L12 [Mycolicibacterium cosmeticum]TLH68831.1 50S ribosomal protein L12 [Mycolicibacterium cosmeticum]CDO05559.1 50S ribosomal protein L12 [Mycolicibacterium cosmeticum]